MRYMKGLKPFLNLFIKPANLMKFYFIGLTAWTIASFFAFESALNTATKNDCIYGNIHAACLQLARDSK